MSTKGSCICGSTSYKITGEPAMTGICHCKSCRKLAGGAYLTFMMVPEGNFEFVDNKAVKQVTVKHEVGMPLRVSFCGDCGVALCKLADDEKFKGSVIVFTGTLDDEGEALGKTPQAELWTKYRVDWVGKVGSGEMMQFEGFPG